MHETLSRPDDAAKKRRQQYSSKCGGQSMSAEAGYWGSVIESHAPHGNAPLYPAHQRVLKESRVITVTWLHRFFSTTISAACIRRCARPGDGSGSLRSCLDHRRTVRTNRTDGLRHKANGQWAYPESARRRGWLTIENCSHFPANRRLFMGAVRRVDVPGQ